MIRTNAVTTVAQMVLLVVAVLAINPLKAAPTRRQPQTVRQPDGQQITIVAQGDEWHHWITDLEGNLLVSDAEGYYRRANPEQQTEWQQSQQSAVTRRQDYLNIRQASRSTATRSRTRGTEGAKRNHLSQMPSRGTVHELVILVDFPDAQFSDQIDQCQYYKDFLMKRGFNDLGSNGSVHDYFVDNSMGIFDPQFDVYGPVRMKEPLAYYGSNNSAGNDKRPAEMIIEACQALDDVIDFSRYDNDGNGFIDVVHVIFAGEGENNISSKPDLIWPHSWSIYASLKQYIELDGKRLDEYMCTCELYNGMKDGIGTFCHEFCHTLGLVDVYNTKGENFVACYYDLMDNGFYLGGYQDEKNREGRCPCALTSYERYELGWLEPDRMIANKHNYEFHPWKDTIQVDDHLSYIVTRIDSIPVFAPDTLLELTSSNSALLLQVRDDGKDPRDGEYYIFENRQQTGWDYCLPGHGMLVWHIDYDDDLWFSNTVNTSASHQCIMLVKANSQPHSAGMAMSDPFPGSKLVSKFTADTKPALLGWDHKASGSGMSQWLNNAAVTEIHEDRFPQLSSEMAIVLSFTDDGPLVLPEAIDNVFISQEMEQIQPRRIWRDGQLQIETSSGYYDLHGRRIR